MAQGLPLKPVPHLLVKSPFHTSTHHSFTLRLSSRYQSTMAPHHHRIPSISSDHKATKPHLKHPTFGHLPLSTSGPLDCSLKGTALLSNPYYNKGAGFPAEERKQFKLTGRLPQNVQTLDQQVKRAYEQYCSRHDDLAKNTFMTSLASQNLVLYFRVSRISGPGVCLYVVALP
jgi:hypothetical protein